MTYLFSLRFRLVGMPLIGALAICFCGALSLIGLNASVDAQVVTRAIRMVPSSPTVIQQSSSTPIQIQQLSGGGIPQAVPAGSPVSSPGALVTNTAAAPVVKSLDDQRIELLMQTKFDRTPAGILKAWSTQNEIKKSETAKGKSVKPITATVANAFDGFVVVNVDDAKQLKANQIVELYVLPANDSEPGKETESIARMKVLSVDGNQVSGRLVVKKKTVSTGNQSMPASEPTKNKENASEDKTKDDQKSEGDNPAEQQQDVGDAAQTDGVTIAAEKAVPAKSPEADAKPKSDQKDQVAVPTGPDWPQMNAGDTFKLVVIGAKAKAAAASDQAKIKTEVESFSRDVTLGNWDAVKEYLGKLKDVDKADDVFDKILQAMITAMPKVEAAQAAQQRSQMQQRGETPPTSFLTPADLLALSEAAPKKISVVDPPVSEDKPNAVSPSPAAVGVPVAGAVVVPNLPAGVSMPPEVLAQLQASGQPIPAGVAAGVVAPVVKKPSHHLRSLSQLVRKSKAAGYDLNEFIKALTKGTTHFGGDDPEKRLTAADLLMKSGLYEEAEAFLPTFNEVDQQKEDHRLVILRAWATLSQQQYSKEKIAKWLDLSWQVSQAVLGTEKATEADKKRALTRLIELSTVVDDEIGQKWLDESFTKSTERGMAILANLGSQSADLARKASQTSEAQRVKMLRMQNSAVEKFLELASDVKDDMRPTLTLLAQNWIAESQTTVANSTQNSRSSNMSIDMYGNYFWQNPNQNNRMNGRQKRPIKVGDILEIVPGAKWQSLISPTLLTEIQKLQANLHLRINEEDKAFPYIEDLASEHPETARELVHEFLKIWTRNHDPNTDRRQRNPYIYFYGFDQKAESIPLTRSKQERNLEELTGWIKRIRQMPIKDVDEKLLSRAFTTCHSTAEVYKLDRVKSVFGDLEKLEPKTIAELAQTMRSNLTSVWRSVKTQEAKQTNRKLPDVQKEVLEGYQTARAMVDESLNAAPDNWQLNLAKACIMFDENAYAHSVKKSSEFSDKRDLAFEQFKKAGVCYVKAAPMLEEEKQSTDLFDRWFYASLGAVDLGQIKAENQPDQRQFAKIRECIESLKGEAAKDHMSKFANNLFTRMSPIKPELKFRYLKGGFEIVGDHPRAWEAKSLFDYYKDLVTEIKLDVSLDGDEEVGTKAFGLYVNLKHTNEIERESGGFGKYVQNQNSMVYSFNYGRPTEDYRDKFRDSVDQALGEHFEVVSVTFESADRMKSRPAPGGWRVTPYAYIMLKSKGTEVDRVTPLKLDLDFLDTSGYVVIPIESPALVIDSTGDGSTRPIEDLQVTQTLDERQSGEGKLIVEVSASGKGLIPELEEIVDLNVKDFEVVEIDDQGSLPTTFDENGSDIQILSDRSWTIQYRAKDSTQKANEFAFGKSKRPEAAVKFQRYEDADLVAADPVMTLESNYSQGGSYVLYWLLPIIALGFIGVGIVAWAVRPRQEVKAKQFEVPEDINPFTVLSLLKDIRHRNGINAKQTDELELSINRIESYYFGERTDEGPSNLTDVARSWVERAKG